MLGSVVAIVPGGDRSFGNMCSKRSDFNLRQNKNNTLLLSQTELKMIEKNKMKHTYVKFNYSYRPALRPREEMMQCRS